MTMLRVLRRSVMMLLFVALTLLFLDFTGATHLWLGWVAKLQLIPALLSLNVGVIVVLVLLTLLFGRLYCSVICPLGILQDLVAKVAKVARPKRKYSYSPALNLWRYGVLALFIVAFVAGVGSVVVLLDPYSTYGVMVTNLLSPIYRGCNNLLAMVAEHYDSYALYSVEFIGFSLAGFILSLISLAVVGYLAWRGGRTYCNTICPVGTVLGLLSKFSLFKIEVDRERCNGCQRCVRDCKSSCISSDEREVDYTRCVVCFNCIDSCTRGAVSYTWRRSPAKSRVKCDTARSIDESKRSMLAISATMLASSALAVEDKIFDGGLAVIEDKKIPERKCSILPAGAESHRNFANHCTGCQLCVSACPNGVLRPSTTLQNFMQPEMSYERGYCRVECTACSDVCPTGAIRPIGKDDKSSIQIGHAVFIERNCVVLRDGVSCGNCAKHCPVGAITMVEMSGRGGVKIPYVDVERCIGCGACENLCPARPFSAIYVEGHKMHKTI